MTLLLQTPPNIQYEILDRILKLDQVQSYSDEHFWHLSSSTVVGTIHIQIANDGDEQRVTAQVCLSSLFFLMLTILHLGSSHSQRSSNTKCCYSSRETNLFQSFKWS